MEKMIRIPPKRDLAEGLKKLEALVGNTPIQKLNLPKVELYCKLEFLNYSGSIKDRSALYVIKNGVKSGEINERTTIVESSSGNFASSLATFCKFLGLHFQSVIDPNITKTYENFLNVSCENVHKVTTKDTHGGYQRVRIAKVQELVAQITDSFWPNQYANVSCMEAHYASTGGEVCEQIDHLDYAFIAVSSGGCIAGLSNRLREHYPGIKIIAVDAVGSVIFSDKARPRYIPGVGSTSRPALVDDATIDEVVHVEEPDTIDACHELVRDYGLFGGGSTGTAFSAIKSYFDDYHGPSRPKVLMLAADRGHAYLDTIYNPDWCQWLSSQYPDQQQARPQLRPQGSPMLDLHV